MIIKYYDIMKFVKKKIDLLTFFHLKGVAKIV